MKRVFFIVLGAIDLFLVIAIVSMQLMSRKEMNNTIDRAARQLQILAKSEKGFGRYDGGQYTGYEVKQAIEQWQNIVVVTVNNKKDSFDYPRCDLLETNNPVASAYIDPDTLYKGEVRYNANEVPALYFTVLTSDGITHDSSKIDLANAIGGDASPEDSYSVLVNKLKGQLTTQANNIIGLQLAIEDLNKELTNLQNSVEGLKTSIKTITENNTTRLQEETDKYNALASELGPQVQQKEQEANRLSAILNVYTSQEIMELYKYFDGGEAYGRLQ